MVSPRWPVVPPHRTISQAGSVNGGIIPKIQADGQSLMRAAMTQLNLSAWAYQRILKLARTVAALGVKRFNSCV